jgi:hypothetical protein
MELRSVPSKNSIRCWIRIVRQNPRVMRAMSAILFTVAIFMVGLFKWHSRSIAGLDDPDLAENYLGMFRWFNDAILRGIVLGACTLQRSIVAQNLSGQRRTFARCLHAKRFA